MNDEDDVDIKIRSDIFKYTFMFLVMVISKLFYFPFIYLMEHSVEKIQYLPILSLYIILLIIVWKSWLQRTYFRVQNMMILYFTMLFCNYPLMMLSYYLALTSGQKYIKELPASLIFCGIYNFYTLVEFMPTIYLMHLTIKEREPLLILCSAVLILVTIAELHHFDTLIYQLVM